jgi:hypothetical protein
MPHARSAALRQDRPEWAGPWRHLRTALRVSAVRLPGTEAERFGMSPAVVPGQDLAEATGPARDGAVADLAARDRELGDGHREAAGT